MRRQQLFLILFMAVMAVLTVGCQKDEGTVTLVAEIQETMSGNGKVYIDGHTPCWHNGDEVYINNAVYPVTVASGAIAQIENVESAKDYQAIYPVSIVVESSKARNSSIEIILPSMQTYRLANGRQQVDVPMGAYLTKGNTLQFYNLCSIVRVTVHNQLGRALPLGRIELRAKKAKLSGSGTATVSRKATNIINMSSSAQNNVGLAFTSDCPATVEAQDTSSFDIVVPSFTTDDVTLTLYTSDGYMCEVVKESMAMARNFIAAVTLDVTALTEAPHAELISGPAFYDAIPKSDKAKSVVFEYNSPVTSGTLLSTPDSPVPIYGNLDGTTWRVSTRASQIHANPNCSNMFKSSWYFSTSHAGRERHIILLLKKIDFGNGFITSNVTDMSGMFISGHELKSLDLSNFNTSNVTDMSRMFAGCWGLTSLNLSNFNTSNVQDMSEMFDACCGLTSLDLPNFNTENVTDMSRMFAQCLLTSLNLSNFNTSKVTNMREMFNSCDKLTSLDLSNFNTENVTDMSGMFADCSSLTSLSISNFNTEKVVNMCSMFAGCSGLTSLNLSNFNTSNVQDMSSMFSVCIGLTSLDLSNFNTSNVTNMYAMFEVCRMSALDLSSFNTEKVTNMSEMFLWCEYLTSLNLAHFDMSNVSSKRGMCHDLSTSSGACTITCPTAVRTALENGTDLPTSGVTFTWVTSTP